MIDISSPVVIGGIGGSGTRLVTKFLLKCGFFMGSDLNASLDNLRFTSLFPELRRLMQLHNEHRNEVISTHISDFFSRYYLDMTALSSSLSGTVRWGWKVPTSFYVIPETLYFFNNCKYIHVIRHGLDMALSNNKNQLRNWSFFFNISQENISSENAALIYWINANNFAVHVAKDTLGSNFLLLNYDDLLHDPQYEIKRLLQFLEIEDISSHALIEEIHGLSGSGRYKSMDLTEFDDHLLNEVRKFGFEV